MDSIFEDLDQSLDYHNNSIQPPFLEDNDEEESLVTLLDAKDEELEENQFEDIIDEDQFNERNKNEEKQYISDSVNKAKSIEPK